MPIPLTWTAHTPVDSRSGRRNTRLALADLFQSGADGVVQYFDGTVCER